MKSLTILNEVAEMVALEPFVDELGEEYDLDMALTFQLKLALDEAVSNVVNYAYGDQKGLPITLDAEIVETADGRDLQIVITDQGFPFDPLAEAPEVDTTLGAEEREIGGLGIFLIRQMMDDVKYRRDDDKNVFTMTKHITA